MGWHYSLDGSRADLIRELTRAESDDRGWSRRALKHSLAGNVLWTVWEITAAADDSQRLHIGCDLLGRHGGTWGWKPLCEDDEPSYYTCPLAYLEMVPEQRPVWREKVKEYWKARREKMKARRTLQGARHG